MVALRVEGLTLFGPIPVVLAPQSPALPATIINITLQLFSSHVKTSAFVLCQLHNTGH